MAWLVKSELNGAPLTQEQYEKETLMLPRGKQRYASLYETLYYLQDIDLIVILACRIRNIEIPELFCISHEEALYIKSECNVDEAHRKLNSLFDDEIRKDGCSRRYRFNVVKYPLKDISNALLDGHNSPDKQTTTTDFLRIQKSILSLQNAYASDVLACIDEKDKKGYLWFTASFRPRYNEICKEFTDPRDEIERMVNEDVSFNGTIKNIIGDVPNDTYLCGRKIPGIILELEGNKQIIRKEKWFVPAVSARQLVMCLDEEKKRYLRNAFIYWIHKKNGDEYTDDTIDMYYKS
jgi:hypothetical protein